jgi:hypothetical protein
MHSRVIWKRRHDIERQPMMRKDAKSLTDFIVMDGRHDFSSSRIDRQIVPEG